MLLLYSQVAIYPSIPEEPDEPSTPEEPVVPDEPEDPEEPVPPPPPPVSSIVATFPDIVISVTDDPVKFKVVALPTRDPVFSTLTAPPVPSVVL